jgi:hypothetical protein
MTARWTKADLRAPSTDVGVSLTLAAEKSFGSMKSNSPVRSDFGKEERGDLYERRKLDPLTTHQQKRHFPERDQFINTSNALIAK